MSVRHASHEEHVKHHAAWFDDALRGRYSTGRDLWEERALAFPNLVFLDRVADDLAKLASVWVEPVRSRLAELDRCVAEWRRSAPAPSWRSHITPESDTRRHLTRFTDLDGITRFFEWHARFTPGPGRIHFRIDAAAHRLVIAYIGRKLM